MRAGVILAGAGAAGALALAAVVLWPVAADGDGRIPADPDAIARGGAIYAEHCAACHGARLEGQPDWRVRKADGKLPAPPHDKEGHTWHHADAQIFEITKYGVARYAPEGYRTDMPIYDGILSDADIWAVLGYIKSRWGPREREVQERVDKAYRESGN